MAREAMLHRRRPRAMPRGRMEPAPGSRRAGTWIIDRRRAQELQISTCEQAFSRLRLGAPATRTDTDDCHVRWIDPEGSLGVEQVSYGSGLVGGDLPIHATGAAVEVPMDFSGEHMKLLAPVHAVVMLDIPEILEDIQGSIHGRRCGGWVELPALFDQLAAADVARRSAQDLDERSALRRPSKAMGAQSLPHEAPGRVA